MSGSPKPILTFAGRIRHESRGQMLLGTRDTFHPHALAALATLLSRWPSAPPGEACAAVLAPSRELGAGAALAVARVP